MKSLQFSDPASGELSAAVRWYEQKRPGLGAELFNAVVETMDLIQVHPEIGASRTGRQPSRQIRVRRFPYKVVYRVRDHDVYVVAIAHASRRPGYWQDRK